MNGCKITAPDPAKLIQAAVQKLHDPTVSLAYAGALHEDVNHLAAVNLRNQMHELKRSLADELIRIAETYKSEFEINQAREMTLQENLAKLIDVAGSSSQAQVQLHNLESKAQSYRNLYDDFLQRFMEATQQQTFPINEARLIARAVKPDKRSSPKALIVLPGSIFIGLLLGFAVAFGRERLDNVFRTATQVEMGAGIECLGILPKVASPLRSKAERTKTYETARKQQTEADLSRHIVAAPFSRFAEILRGIKVQADIWRLTRETRVLGIVSSLPNEGKTTVATNLAHLLAQNGNRTLLIDGDLRRRSLTQELMPAAQNGLLEVLDGALVADVLWRDGVTNLDILPIVAKSRFANAAEVLSSLKMAHFLAQIRECYEYIVVDLPPAIPVVDVKAASHLIDGIVFVVEWGVTSKESVIEALSDVELLRERMLGAVLNKADPKILKRLERYKGRYYKAYYQEPHEAA